MLSFTDPYGSDLESDCLDKSSRETVGLLPSPHRTSAAKWKQLELFSQSLMSAWLLGQSMRGKCFLGAEVVHYLFLMQECAYGKIVVLLIQRVHCWSCSNEWFIFCLKSLKGGIYFFKSFWRWLLCCLWVSLQWMWHVQLIWTAVIQTDFIYFNSIFYTEPLYV